MQIKVEQELFLSSIKTSIKNFGVLHLKGGKFHLSLKGNPSSLTVFDGQSLWYQADTNEKLLVFLKNPLPIQILSSFFNEKIFFETFSIQNSRKKNNNYIFQLIPNKEIKGLDEIFIKVGRYISELRIIWKDLGNWQSYHFSMPFEKKIPDNFFKFSTKGFKIIRKNE